jgi:GTPase
MIDLCGHEKYLKTTMVGLSGYYPQYAMLVVGANMGISRMTKEHIGIAISLKIPMFVVVTKIDIAPENVYLDTLASL